MLKTIYKNINAGKEYGYMFNNVTYPFFNTVLSVSENNKYIRWQHFGSSANRNTIDDLQWIIETIFETTPEEFVKKYECRKVA